MIKRGVPLEAHVGRGEKEPNCPAISTFDLIQANMVGTSIATLQPRAAIFGVQDTLLKSPGTKTVSRERHSEDLGTLLEGYDGVRRGGADRLKGFMPEGPAENFHKSKGEYE